MEDIIADRMNSVVREKARLFGGMLYDPKISRYSRSMVRAAGAMKKRRKAGSKTSKKSKSMKYGKSELMKKKKSSLVRMIMKMMAKRGGAYAGVSAGAHKK